MNLRFRREPKAPKLASLLTICFLAISSALPAQPPQTTSTKATLPNVPDSAEEVQPLKVGDKAADATVYTADAEPLELADVYSSAPTVLIFYRGGWCPYCTAHLGKLATIEDDLTSAGYQIVAISPDAPRFLKETSQKHDVNYLLLSDSNVAAARAFGLAFRVDDKTADRYLKFKNPINLEERAGETHHVLPVPAAYVIDRQGVIQYAYSSPDYKVRIDEKALLEAALKSN